MVKYKVTTPEGEEIRGTATTAQAAERAARTRTQARSPFFNCGVLFGYKLAHGRWLKECSVEIIAEK